MIGPYGMVIGAAGSRGTSGRGVSIGPPQPAKPPAPDQEAIKSQIISVAPPNVSPSQAARQPPTARIGASIPWVCGATRIMTANAVWVGPATDIVETQVVEDPSTGVPTEYEVPGRGNNVQLLLCLGPGVVLRRILAESVVLWEGTAGPAATDIAVNSNGLKFDARFYGGELDQLPDLDMMDLSPDVVPASVGFCYIVLKGANFSVADTPLQFDVERHPNPLGLDPADNVDDDGNINLMTIAYDVSVSQWGGGNMPASMIDTASMVAAAERLASEGNFGTCILQNETPLSAVLELIQDQADAMFVANPETGRMTVQLPRKSDVTAGSGYKRSFTVNKNLINLRRYAKELVGTALTTLAVSFVDRDSGFEKSWANIQTAPADGTDRKGTIEFPMNYRSDLANQLVAREFEKMVTPLYSFSIETTRDGADLLPGDIIRVTWPDSGLRRKPAMVLRRRAMSLKDNTAILDCVQFDTPDIAPLFADPDQPIIVVGGDPVPPVDVKIIDVPYSFYMPIPFAGGGEIVTLEQQAYASRIQAASKPFFLVAPGNAAQKSVRVSNTSDVTLTNDSLGIEFKNASGGLLTEAIERADGFDTGMIDELHIANIFGAAQIRPANTVTDIRERQGMIFINDEIFGYETFTRNLDGSGTFFNVYRALVDTVAGDHDIGDRVYVMNLRNSPTDPGFNFNMNSTLVHYLVTSPETSATFRLRGVTLDPEYGLRESTAYFETDPWTPVDRLTRPPRPHDTRIDGVRSPDPIPLEPLDPFDVTWRIRSRTVPDLILLSWYNAAQPSPIQFQGDASQSGERYLDTADSLVYHQYYRVMLRDSEGTVFTLTETNNDADYATANVSVPAEAALGLGYIWVDAVLYPKSIFINSIAEAVSLYKDELPVLILDDVFFVSETEDELLVSEDELNSFTEE